VLEALLKTPELAGEGGADEALQKRACALIHFLLGENYQETEENH
jgi:hypothetical protein